jgi:NAD(P)H-flavin reductase
VRALGAPSPMLPSPVRVLRTRRETADTVTLTLEAPFPSLPGQFNMLYAFAVGEVPISMSGDPARTSEMMHTIKAVGAVSRALSGVKKGAVIGVLGPFGRPWPLDALRGMDVIVVAGGLGLAPLRPAVHHLIANRGDYGRVSVLVGARTPGDLLYRAELDRWDGKGVSTLVTVDRAGPDWRGRVGVAPALLQDVPLDPERTAALVCGPEVMMRFTVRDLLRRGLAEDRIHVSLERNMECAVGFCGHCQLGPEFVCKDGPVFQFDRIRHWFWLREA